LGKEKARDELPNLRGENNNPYAVGKKEKRAVKNQ